MQTTSHLLITAVVNRKSSKRPRIPINTYALLIGSILPDIPFVILTLGYMLYYRQFAVLPTDSSIMEYLHMTLFFTDPIWIISHNMFHSLLVNMALILAGFLMHRYWPRWGAALFWLAISMQFHTVIDVFTHHSDGPILFFPLSWNYRFPSPISYWEAAYYGNIFVIFEYTLDALLVGYLVWAWFQRKKKPRR